MYPLLNVNAAIPSFALIAVTAWTFGTKAGLIATLINMIYHAYLLSFFYGDQFVCYQTKLTSPILYITISYVAGYLRQNYDGIRKLNQELDSLVRKRDQELTWLSNELLENAENRRVALGQELHDGIGQQLTGIKLISSSLESQLKHEPETPADLTAKLSQKASNAHNDIRMIARTLFPVRIAQVGLYSALNEMISCYAELHQKSMHVIECSDLRGMTETLALQLYRMCQECCTFLLEHSNANLILLTLKIVNDNYVVEIEHNGQVEIEDETCSIYNLIRYRADKICGTLQTTDHDTSGRSVIYFKVPLPTH
ncbi:sensor histidine kinase [Pontiella agarivorans]|uniref:Histidine kinase n=1 Tax=Pontiella agarivorans TaxID=3038953 RepID=A0ABU5MTB4_9BACT|nr:histidine kinase [Pontiella agarivorans]MDZ8117367.1 histidine kinase [Pontiella agarivorans]